MTVIFPVKSISQTSWMLLLACACLIPSVALYCNQHQTKPQILTAEIVRVPVARRCIALVQQETTSLAQEQSEHNATAVVQNVEQQLWPDFCAYNDTYDGPSGFGGEYFIANLFSNIWQLIGKFLVSMPVQAAFIGSAFVFLWTAAWVAVTKL